MYRYVQFVNSIDVRPSRLIIDPLLKLKDFFCYIIH